MGHAARDPLWRELVLPVLHGGSLAVGLVVGMVPSPLTLFDSQVA